MYHDITILKMLKIITIISKLDHCRSSSAMDQNPATMVNTTISGKWMFIRPKIVFLYVRLCRILISEINI